MLSLDAGEGTTAVRFFPHIGVGGAITNRMNVRFKVDGVAYVLNGNGLTLGGAGDPDAVQLEGVTVVKSLAVPEPCAFTLLLPGALGLARRRRSPPPAPAG